MIIEQETLYSFFFFSFYQHERRSSNFKHFTVFKEEISQGVLKSIGT